MFFQHAVDLVLLLSAAHEKNRSKNVSKRLVVTNSIRCAAVLAGFALLSIGISAAAEPGMPEGAGQPGGSQSADDSDCQPVTRGSPYIPVDSWIYPAVLRLYALGYVDTVYLGLRPWTRASVSRMLDETEERLEDVDQGQTASEAEGLYDALKRELRDDNWKSCEVDKGTVHVESVYSVARAISGTPLDDSYHLGSTIVNDYGRPFANGFNNYSGASGYASAGRFVLYVRGEFQGAPSTAGYSSALAQTLSSVDQTLYFVPSNTPPYGPTTVVYNQATIPQGTIPTATQGRFLEAYVSYEYLNHVFSFGKQDEWLGPAQGGSFAYSNNAQNIYAFHIDRVEPLEVPLLSRLTGPFRYEFLVGELQGHTYMPNPAYEANPSPAVANVTNPGNPWVHLEKINFRPTSNLELGFERTVIWGGKGHEPITIKSFLRSFFSLSSPECQVPTPADPNPPCAKDDSDDPGARFASFDFSYRLPFVRNWLLLYCDSEVHDDVSPADAPRRASWRPGLYLSHVPGIPKLDVRVEGISTDPPVSTSNSGRFMYYEGIERQGYTNKGQLFGDWIGREDKGGQGWITYHLSGNESIQIGLRDQKAAKDFIPGGTTLNEINFRAVKRVGKDFEMKGDFTYEHWKAPIYLSGQQTVTTTTIQLTWFPGRKVNF